MVTDPAATRMMVHKNMSDYLHETYLKKNADYGSAFEILWDEVGSLCGYTKIADKFYRIRTLMSPGYEPKVNESVIDSLLDLANYCLLSAVEIEMRRTKDYVD